MLGWTMMDLSKAAKVSVSTVRRMEAPDGQRVSGDMLALIHAVMRDAGVSFLVDDGEGPGVRVRAPR